MNILWILSRFLPVGIITYRQARHLAEDLHDWREIAKQRDEVGVVYGNCATTIESALGRRRVRLWVQKYGHKEF